MPDDLKKAIALFNEQLRPFFVEMVRLGVGVKITVELQYADWVDKFELYPAPPIRSTPDDTDTH
jgi:hypothetical protein